MNNFVELENQFYLNVFKRAPFLLTRGKGLYCYDHQGKKYLDFIAGLGVNAFGYGDPEILASLKRQSAKLIHCTNLYYTEPQLTLAQILIRHSCTDKVFFCNSGTEAVEGAIKFARRYGHEKFRSPRHEIISFYNGFHGRTMGGLSATAQRKFHTGFTPLLPGFKYCTFNDFDSVKRALSPKTCAILIEPVQGEGGIYPAEKKFLQQLEQLCRQKDLLLIVDEIQCGLGRTGSLFAYQQYGMKPHLITLAKPLAAGLPIGAVLIQKKVAQFLRPGDHGSTFCGNPLACAIGITVLKKLIFKRIPQKVKALGQYFLKELEVRIGSHPRVKEIRGRGLMIGIELDSEVAPLVSRGYQNGLLIGTAGKNIIRLLPPLIIEKKQVDLFLQKFIMIFLQQFSMAEQR